MQSISYADPEVASERPKFNDNYSAVQNYETTSIFDSFSDLKCNNIYT